MGDALDFLFFSASGSRRSYYILPILPFCALFCANWILSLMAAEAPGAISHVKRLALATTAGLAAAAALPLLIRSQSGMARWTGLDHRQRRCAAGAGLAAPSYASGVLAESGPACRQASWPGQPLCSLAWAVTFASCSRCWNNTARKKTSPWQSSYRPQRRPDRLLRGLRRKCRVLHGHDAGPITG